VQLENLKLKV